MKKRIKCMMSFFLIGIISLLFPADARAEKIFSQELTELFGFGEAQCYVCGEATEDGVVQLKANATSLEDGNIVEVQVFYYNSKAKQVTLCYKTRAWISNGRDIRLDIPGCVFNIKPLVKD